MLMKNIVFSLVLAAAVVTDQSLRHFNNDIMVPLSTQDQWIVDQTNVRVKMACVNWPSHMENMIPEGLGSSSMSRLVDFIVSMGFNCVRFPYAVEMVERFQDTLDTRVYQWMSKESREGLFKNNPKYNNKTTIYEVFSDAMNMMKQKGLMVFLDNHVSKATWCCPEFDGNRFWEREWFPVDGWVNSLKSLAVLVKEQGWNHVVGFGLRNEVFTVNPNADSMWFKFMRIGMHAVHETNPDLLVVVGGQNFASKFTQMFSQDLVDDTFPESIRRKIVYEFHYYNQFYVGYWWNKVGGAITCFGMKWFLNSNIGFLTKPGHKYTGPIWLSEFGLNITDYKEDKSTNDNQWLNCLTEWMTEHDVDFGYWVLNGRHYFRETKPFNASFDFVENWGLLCDDHNCTRNDEIISRIKPLMKMTQGPGVEYSLEAFMQEEVEEEKHVGENRLVFQN
ncbi:hypothetical protein MP638_000872 [Amoeboaphelidium occidentale]|nr:hypothetical protein MP638_000872 [Amoeboaphelidium occidentale]